MHQRGHTFEGATESGPILPVLVTDAARVFTSCSIHNRFDLPYTSQSTLAQQLHDSCADRGGCAGAVEWLADAAEQTGENEAACAAFERLKSIDPIRRLYVAASSLPLA